MVRQLRIVNLGHPLAEPEVRRVGELVGAAVHDVRSVEAQFDPAQPLGPQVERLIADVGLSAVEWQAGKIVLNLPGHSVLAAAVLATVHGLSGGFPPVLRLRRVPLHNTFEVAEVIDLQGAREAAREDRFG